MLLLRGRRTPKMMHQSLNNKSLVDIYDDVQQDTILNATATPTQGEPQSSGTSDDPNVLVVVFRTPEEGLMTIKEVALQLQEIKRLDDLKAVKDKSEETLRRDEYLNCIEFKDDQLPIINISYRVTKSTNIATMHITRNNQPLNYKIFEDFRLKMLGFTEWLELHKLASKKQGVPNDQLLKNLKAKFKWVATTSNKLNIPTPHQLTDFEIPPVEQKQKRATEILKEVFVSKYVVVDGMHMSLTPPQGVTSKKA
ncbi:hypothetical protein Tco_1199986 [Tanacetum coccineum]